MDFTSSLLWLNSITIYSLMMIGMLRLMNLNMSLVVIVRCVVFFVLIEENANLTNSQKELLLLHRKLDKSMHHIKVLMHIHSAREPNGKHSLMQTVIILKFIYFKLLSINM